jgi:hypothetical protein
MLLLHSQSGKCPFFSARCPFFHLKKFSLIKYPSYEELLQLGNVPREKTLLAWDLVME